jgi:hypothetical protein
VKFVRRLSEAPPEIEPVTPVQADERRRVPAVVSEHAVTLVVGVLGTIIAALILFYASESATSRASP